MKAFVGTVAYRENWGHDASRELGDRESKAGRQPVVDGRNHRKSSS
jgi:hypothetical protein